MGRQGAGGGKVNNLSLPTLQITAQRFREVSAHLSGAHCLSREYKPQRDRSRAAVQDVGTTGDRSH